MKRKELKMLAIYVETEMYQQVRMKAARAGKSMSNVLKEVVGTWLKERKTNQEESKEKDV